MYKVVPITAHKDIRGCLYGLDSTIIPFNIKRIFIVKLTPFEPRGNHAHKKLWEFLIPVSGTIHFSLNNSINIELDTFTGLILPPYYWREYHCNNDNTILLSLCSEEINKDDYINTWEEFIKVWPAT